ncbi:hypothetical protein GH714_007645 [Hevea brasiliensis]|uniref:Uncharacterized protein n=1 Tax=Hevea brasiliensis TaxID=3981 RepID=A0A6A6NC52_HEVBR|nr:hypothetical protein GH714_007645 [Hevea brasiliensis]
MGHGFSFQFAIQCGDASIGRCWDCVAGQALYVCQLEDNLQKLETARDQLRELSNDVMRGSTSYARKTEIVSRRLLLQELLVHLHVCEKRFQKPQTCGWFDERRRFKKVVERKLPEPVE